MISAQTIRDAEQMLFDLRKEFLEQSGWKLIAEGRWRKHFDWGRDAIRIVDADLIDAVNMQIQIEDEREKNEKRFGDV